VYYETLDLIHNACMQPGVLACIASGRALIQWKSYKVSKALRVDMLRALCACERRNKCQAMKQLRCPISWRWGQMLLKICRAHSGSHNIRQMRTVAPSSAV